MLFGEDLREWRVGLGLSSRDLARVLGMAEDGSTVRQMELRWQPLPAGLATLIEVSRDLIPVRTWLRNKAGKTTRQPKGSRKKRDAARAP